MKKLFVGLACTFLFAACDNATVQKAVDDAMMDDAASSAAMMDDDSMMNDDDAMMDDDAQLDAGVYSAYAPDVLMNGETKVFFFHAAWCPVCRAADTKLLTWYAENMPTMNLYKVDYDAETALKSKYGVTYQHTFVVVDGEGNALQTVQGPSDAQLMAMIGAQ